MSGIAGIVHFDGRPIAPGQIEAMTAALRHRGPDGIQHWRKGHVAMGQCMQRTTPESLEETLPLTNEDASLVLVMDGRVDNFEELRRTLLGRGAVLRTRADAELVLRAYEVWGDACPDHIIGECVFFIWDARQQRLFAARDAAGTRHFYYHQGPGWFAFASEIRGLLALNRIDRRLNDSRLVDFLLDDREDQVGTFYQGTLRLPAGHAMHVSERGTTSWRYWNPGELSAQKFASLEECTEAFMDQLRVAVKCRLRSIQPVGAMLSGGLDSSTIVGLISKEFRDALHEPLRTVSLIREDRENCPDWRCINEILKADPWLQPYILSSSRADEVWQSVITGMAQADEPFMHAYGFTYGLTYAAARARGCGVVLDGMAGDTLFYGFNHSANVMGHNRLYRQVPAMLAAWQRHGLQGGNRAALRALLPFEWAPDAVRALARRRRDARALRSGNLQWLKPEVARGYLARNSSSAYWAGERMAPASDQMAHARYFTEGLNASAHETYGSMAKSLGVEPRSPFSDRRMIEFAVRMPLEAKFAWPWYKHVLRNGTAGLLPDAVRWRTEVGMHPGWTFYARLARNVFSGASPAWRGATAQDILSPWVRPEAFPTRAALEGSSGDEDGGQRVLFLTLLAHWVESHGLKD